MTGASAQTRRNRSAGGRKAALFVRNARRDGRYGPEGSHRGSAAPIEDVGTILARLRGLVASKTDGGT